MADAKATNEGLAQLKGPKIVFWISLVLAILATISAIVSFFTEVFDFAASWISAGSVGLVVGSVFSLILAALWVALYWIELSGIAKGKPYAVPLGRFLLIWMMVFSFPIGTIIGAIVWKRFSDPATQKYLNYVK